MKNYYISCGRYYAKVYLGVDCNGKKKYIKISAKTEKELEEKVLERKEAIRNNPDISI